MLERGPHEVRLPETREATQGIPMSILHLPGSQLPDPIDAVQFFEHPRVRFPIERVSNNFVRDVEVVLYKYHDLIEVMNPGDKITRRIREELGRIVKLSESVLQAIREYLRGLPHKAYACLNEGINGVRPELSKCISPVDHPFVDELYRVRQEREPGTTFAKADLFHIPFHERHKVSRQRYSIPGLPCLYLGGSLYICWEELRRPRFESIHVARFLVVPGETIRILDFMQRPQHIARNISKTTTADESPVLDKFCALAVCWPLMATAAIRRLHGDSPFIAEYIIPQLILQWITDNSDPDVDGIAYSSVSCRTHVDYPAGIANFVFPAKEMRDSGQCPRLCRKFAMTAPIAWHLLERVMLPSHPPFAAAMKLELIPGSPTCYSDTAFCELEGKLRTMPAEVILPT
jgi:hypothetical protein